MTIHHISFYFNNVSGNYVGKAWCAGSIGKYMRLLHLPITHGQGDRTASPRTEVQHPWFTALTEHFCALISRPRPGGTRDSGIQDIPCLLSELDITKPTVP